MQMQMQMQPQVQMPVMMMPVQQMMMVPMQPMTQAVPLSAPPAPFAEVIATVDPASVRQLMEMGFSQESVTAALHTTRGNTVAATEILVTDSQGLSEQSSIVVDDQQVESKGLVKVSSY
jgi:hypothetical protein